MTKDKMIAKVPGVQFLEVPENLADDFKDLKRDYELRDPFAFPDPPPLLPAYLNSDLDAPPDVNLVVNNVRGGDETPQDDRFLESDLEHIGEEDPIENFENDDDDILLVDDFWADITDPPASRVNLPPLRSQSPVIPEEPVPRLLRSRGRGRGRGRRAGVSALPIISVADKISQPGRKYNVEYFGGDRPGTFRFLEFKHRAHGNLRCQPDGRNAEILTYCPDRVGRVFAIPDPASSSTSRVEAIRGSQPLNLRAAAFN